MHHAETRCVRSRSVQVVLFSEYAEDLGDGEADGGPREPAPLCAGDVVRLFDPEQRRHLRLSRVQSSDPHRYDAGFQSSAAEEGDDGQITMADSNALWFIEQFDHPSRGGPLVHQQVGHISSACRGGGWGGVGHISAW